MPYAKSNFRSIRVKSVKSNLRKIWEKKASHNYFLSLKETEDKKTNRFD